MSVQNGEVKPKDEEYRVYRRRFAVLAAVIMLNISNATIWITYSPVATTVGNYYGVAPSKVNWFSLVYLVVSFPFTFFSTFIVDKFGLRVGINTGSVLNCMGAIIKAIGTSQAILDKDTQYAVSLTGQTISAMAQSFILYIPTKVSQSWFPENHRAVSTAILAMSNPLGILIASGATPFIVDENESNIPKNNYIWMSLAVLTEIITLFSVTRAKPKTPPSRSAQKSVHQLYFQQLRSAFSTPPYLLLFLTMGCGIGCFNAFATLAQQMLCPLGYSDVAASGSIVMMLFMGFVGSAVAGLLTDKTKKFAEITKYFFGGAAFFGIFMMEFYLVPNHVALLVIFSGLFGFFGVGAYPIGLELALEATYPVEETISSGFIFLSGQIHGILIIAMVPALATVQIGENSYLNGCKSITDVKPKDYTIPVIIVMIYLAIVVSMMIAFLKTKYKRQEADVNFHRKFEDHLSGAVAPPYSVAAPYSALPLKQI